MRQNFAWSWFDWVSWIQELRAECLKASLLSKVREKRDEVLKRSASDLTEFWGDISGVILWIEWEENAPKGSLLTLIVNGSAGEIVVLDNDEANKREGSEEQLIPEVLDDVGE